MIRSLLITLSSFFVYAAAADDGLPTLQRAPLPDEERWALETELTGHQEQNGAVLECLAATLQNLLQQAGRAATVEQLVMVLTTPSSSGTPESTIKELLLPRASHIQVSNDATFALITTPLKRGFSLEIFCDTAYGLSAHRLLRQAR
ncbi:MAG: hypothetical protein IKA23_04835 [Akkermansia sp.]|nr:hypothetical protein [Akkermansia sp.]MBR2313278.1 hypothetical protein [Akkermansia sp.]